MVQSAKWKWRISNFLIGNRLSCLSTKVQLDDILVNKKWINSVLNSEAYLAFRIVMVKIRSSIRRIKKKNSQNHTLRLNNTNYRYRVTVRNKSDSLLETYERRTPNDEYENFVTAYMDAATECVPTKPRTKCSFPWKSIVVRKSQVT